MFQRKRYAVLAIALVAATSAMADGEPRAPQPRAAAPAATPAAPVEQASWDGASVGVGGGVSEVAPSIDTVSSLDTVPGIFLLATFDRSRHTKFDDSDWEGFGTISLGYDRQFGNFVFGVFTDFDFYPDSDRHHSKTLEHTAWGTTTLKSDVHLDEAWNVGGRLGYLVRPNTLLYFVGGYTRANLDGSTTLTHGHDSVSVDAPDHLSGYFIGAGGEMFIRENLSLKFEYRFADYDGERDRDSSEHAIPTHMICEGPCSNNSLHLDTDVDAEIHSLRASLVFHFDDRRTPVQPLK